MRKEATQRTLQQMVRRLVERFDPDYIYLFGSHARGTATHESDIDLLVILPFIGSARAKRIEMRVALNDFKTPTDIVVATPDEMNRWRNVAGTILAPAYAEGKLLYARRG